MYNNLTIDQLRAKAAEYRREMLGGGEGYNPYRAELERREDQAEASRPVSRSERKYQILHELDLISGPAAREMGLGSDEEIANLRAALTAIEQEEQAEFLAEWTVQTTRERRAEWNARVEAGEIKDAQSAQAAMDAQGWGLKALKRAIEIHKL